MERRRAIIPPASASPTSTSTATFTPTSSPCSARFGNVKERKFSEIWQDTSDPDHGRPEGPPAAARQAAAPPAGSRTVCGGSLRARAEITTGDAWAADPGCYLTDEEIAGEPVTFEPADVGDCQLEAVHI